MESVVPELKGFCKRPLLNKSPIVLSTIGQNSTTADETECDDQTFSLRSALKCYTTIDSAACDKTGQ